MSRCTALSAVIWPTDLSELNRRTRRGPGTADPWRSYAANPCHCASLGELLTWRLLPEVAEPSAG